MKQKLRFITIFIITSMLLTGCWDQQEIENTAWVTMFGFDLAEADDRYVVHQMVAETQLLAAGEQSPEGGKSAFFIVSDKSHSIQKAVFGAKEFLSRNPRYSHVSNLIVGEELLKERGISPIISYAKRNHEIRPFVWIAVGAPSALEVMQAPTGLEELPSEAYLGIMDQAEVSGVAFGVNLLEASKRFLNEHRDLVLPLVDRTPPVRAEIEPEHPTPPEGEQGQDQLHINGLALFKKDILVGTLDGFDARGLSWALGRGLGLVTVLSTDEKSITVNFREVDSDIHVEIEEGNDLQATIQMDLSGDITEIQEDHILPFLKIGDIPEVTNDVEEEVQAIIEAAIVKVQEAQSDVFGIAEIISDDYPEAWEELKDGWDEKYGQLPLKVDVKVKLNRSKRLR